ncbi:MAG: hypothetical protein ACK5RG_18405 [Cyclobacteriaceae bacterium]|jgi:hypothetical protein|nr:hypothetical protein [Flammeovirgaceae bacterium]
MKAKTPKKKEPKADPEKKIPSVPSEEREKPFDFGGLPQRDLKKNLGCG